MAPTGPAYNVDWVFSNTSNVHVANHCDWFTTFVDFQTSLGSLAKPGGDMKVLGIGNVELEVRRDEGANKRKKDGKRSTKIILKDVLYAPSSLTNIFGQPIANDFTITWGQKWEILDKDTGGVAGLLDTVVLPKLWLKGQPKGMISLTKGGNYWINARWAEDEQKKWEEYKVAQAAPSLTLGGLSISATRSTQEAHEYWLRANHGGEFYFLREHGLNLYDEEDREAGREMVRGFMTADRNKDEAEAAADGEDEGDGDEGENQFLADLEADPMSHLADRFFAEAELDWIEKHYRHSGRFLLIRGLKAYDDDDCKKGVALVQKLTGGGR